MFIVKEFWFLEGWGQDTGTTQAGTCAANAGLSAVETISESGTCAAAATLRANEVLADQATFTAAETSTGSEALVEDGSNTGSASLNGSGDASESAAVAALAEFVVDEKLVDIGRVIAVAFLAGDEEGGTPAEAPTLGGAIAFVWVGPSAQIRIYLAPRAAAEIASRTPEGDVY